MVMTMSDPVSQSNLSFWSRAFPFLRRRESPPIEQKVEEIAKERVEHLHIQNNLISFFSKGLSKQSIEEAHAFLQKLKLEDLDLIDLKCTLFFLIEFGNIDLSVFFYKRIKELRPDFEEPLKELKEKIIIRMELKNQDKISSLTEVILEDLKEIIESDDSEELKVKKIFDSLDIDMFDTKNVKISDLKFLIDFVSSLEMNKLLSFQEKILAITTKSLEQKNLVLYEDLIKSSHLILDIIKFKILKITVEERDLERIKNFIEEDRNFNIDLIPKGEFGTLLSIELISEDYHKGDLGVVNLLERYGADRALALET
jgi:hypothetical protein